MIFLQNFPEMFVFQKENWSCLAFDTSCYASDLSFIAKLFGMEQSSVWKGSPSSIRVSAVTVRSADAGCDLSKTGGKRWTGMEIVEDGDRQPRGGQEWPLHFSACVSIIAAYGGSPQGDVLLISLRARGQLGDAYQYLQGIMCHPDGELIWQEAYPQSDVVDIRVLLLGPSLFPCSLRFHHCRPSCISLQSGRKAACQCHSKWTK